jgi:cbb3-type cytochrome oxidase maturation protein
MSDNIIILMLGISTFLGALGLWALLWGLKSGQFNDEKKFLDGVKYDSPEELQDAILMEQRKKEALARKKEKQKNYMPED